MSRIRIVYFGTPAYAVPALEAVANEERFAVALVVTQPDRPAGRGHRLAPPPVKEAALALGLPVYQPASLRTVEARQPLLDADADLFIVAAFGLIFGEKTLAIPRRGAVNLHASLLPAYRGANPIAAAIASGEAETGVSLMVMERGLDSGPVIAARSLPIEDDDTTASLTDKLGRLGAALLIDEIGGFVDGTIQPVPQPEAGVTFPRPMRKSDGEVDWTAPAAVVERHVRAMWPWPRAWSRLGDQVVQIHAAAVASLEVDAPAGTIIVAQGSPHVACGDGALVIRRVQFPGRAAIEARAAISSRQLSEGMRFDSAPENRESLVIGAMTGSSTNA